MHFDLVSLGGVNEPFIYLPAQPLLAFITTALQGRLQK